MKLLRREPIIGNFNRVELPKSIREKEILIPTDTPSGRFYFSDSTKKIYPSVTTMLEHDTDLTDWVNRVGEKEANNRAFYAKEYGSMLHETIESYLNNKPIETWNLNPILAHNFSRGRNYLDRISDIMLLEEILYSDKLKLAGRTDCIANFDGKLSIIDFKNSSKKKKEEWIENYGCQATAYAEMFEEQYDSKIQQLVILMFVQGEEIPQLFIFDRHKYKDMLLDKIRKYEVDNETD